MTPHDALARYFGFAAFRPGQLEAIQQLLAGQDLLTVMPTGAGKSLIYQLAALLLPGVTLVVSPLVALMKDQVDTMTRRGLPATLINSSLNAAEQDQRLHALARGKYKIVLVAPERLRSAAFTAALGPVPLSLLVVDEAHCLSQWGHDFRPDYLHIIDARRMFRPRLTLALTATATKRVQEDILQLLGIARAERLVMGFNRPNLFLQVIHVRGDSDKRTRLRGFLEEKRGAGIVYTGTRREAEEIAGVVRTASGIQTEYYHAGLDSAERDRVQDAFLSGSAQLICATVAFGMGIDRPDVRFVLHYSIPGSLEAYYQEVGRAGRDGFPARGILLYSAKDKSLQEYLIEKDSPTARGLRAVHEFLVSSPRTSFEVLAGSTRLSETCARIAVEHLEAARAIHRIPQPDLTTLQVQVLPLHEATLNSIAGHVQERKSHKRELLARMVSYAETNACRRRAILEYFGDTGPADAPACCDNHGAHSDSRQFSPSTSNTIYENNYYNSNRRAEGNLSRRQRPVGLITGMQSKSVQEDRELFGNLCAWRRARAHTEGKPDYAVLSDIALHQIAAIKPQSDRDLLMVPDIDRRKLEKYGKGILAHVRESTGRKSPS